MIEKFYSFKIGLVITNKGLQYQGRILYKEDGCKREVVFYKMCGSEWCILPTKRKKEIHSLAMMHGNYFAKKMLKPRGYGIRIVSPLL